jgi:hypothetical protein
MANKEDKFIIIRTDLFVDQEALQATLADWKAKGLDLKKEIEKMIKLGYIKRA